MATPTNKELFCGAFAKVLKEKLHVDVRLKAGDSKKTAFISAHKLVLSARSEVFKKMLEPDKGKASSKLETVTLSELKHEELEALVEFIYSDGSTLSEQAKQHVMSLFIAADKYEIPHLRDLCRTQLILSLKSSNALNVLELAQIPFDKSLYDAAFATVKTNFSTISSSAEFKSFVVNQPDLTVEIVKTCATRGRCSSCGNSCRFCHHR